ncbi:MAG: PDZ domain-containing protein [Acidobacteriota bacterium]
MDSPPNFSAPVNQSGNIACAQCGAPMPPTMRFCRSCGQRLGEGPAEYTETVRFPNAAQPATGARFTAPFTPNPNAPLARQAAAKSSRRRWGLTGMTWVWIGLGVFFAGGGVLSMFKSPSSFRPPRISAPAPSKSYFGVNSFSTKNGGATFSKVEPPGSPADKAGMVGGDIITSFDGRPVTKSDDMTNLLRQTPIGKTVEVIYLRDGVPNKTQLTTISEDEFERLKEVFDNRPEGQGFFGYEAEDTTVISQPETKTYGVRIDNLTPNDPAVLFGLREKDIITEFDGVPIRTSEELLSRVKRAIPGKSIKIAVIRDGQRVEVPVTMGKDD